MYNVNWYNRILELFPIIWRTPKRWAFVYVALKEINALHIQFLDFIARTRYLMSFTGQVVYLERLLNDLYDNIQRGIYITNTAEDRRLWLFKKVENKEKVWIFRKHKTDIFYSAGNLVAYKNSIYRCLQFHMNVIPVGNPAYWQFVMPNLYIYKRQEIYGSVDFIINIPLSVTFEENQLKAWVERYKLAGKRYLINTY